MCWCQPNARTPCCGSAKCHEAASIPGPAQCPFCTMLKNAFEAGFNAVPINAARCEICQREIVFYTLAGDPKPSPRFAKVYCAEHDPRRAPAPATGSAQAARRFG